MSVGRMFAGSDMVWAYACWLERQAVAGVFGRFAGDTDEVSFLRDHVVSE
jgi:hypothetical protein